MPRGKAHEAPQAYNEAFARAYNLRWSAWAAAIAPVIEAYYRTLPVAGTNTRILDVCCGTGQLLSWFLDRGYTGTGLDSSAHMLAYAGKNSGLHLKNDTVSFIRADAADFTVKREYGLAVSTFDALNHLPDRAALSSCFSCVKAALVPGGCFIFDLNTRKALEMWNGINVEETDELFLLTRGVFGGGMTRAYNKITGFLKTGGSAYERFEQTAYNTLFSMREVREDLLKCGFDGVTAAGSKALGSDAEDPEALTRVFFTARVAS